jgi:outer membrane cobalamin receptor
MTIRRSAVAQTEPDAMMPTTVVTADRFPTDPAKVTASYTVVLQEEMQRRQLRNAAEVLRTIPGLHRTRHTADKQQRRLRAW